jgi:hypothetical protein
MANSQIDFGPIRGSAVFFLIRLESYQRSMKIELLCEAAAGDLQSGEIICMKEISMSETLD